MIINAITTSFERREGGYLFENEANATFVGLNSFKWINLEKNYKINLFH